MASGQEAVLHRSCGPRRPLRQRRWRRPLAPGPAIPSPNREVAGKPCWEMTASTTLADIRSVDSSPMVNEDASNGPTVQVHLLVSITLSQQALPTHTHTRQISQALAST